MSKWYIDKIKAAAPELLDGNTADIMDWIDNAFAMYAEDADIAAKMDDAIKEALDNLHEEIADVLVCCEVLPVDWTIIREIKQKKSDRWTLRLRDRKEVP